MRRSRDKLLAAQDVDAGDEERRARPLPEDCPVKPLGMLGADTPTAVFLTASGTISKMTGQALGQGNIEALFAPQNPYLTAQKHWARYKKNGDLDGFHAELVRADLLMAAGRRGIWDELDSVRGAGAWKTDKGELLLHLGDRVLHSNRLLPWGEIDGRVYPASAALLGPSHERQTDGPGGPAHELLGMLRTWNWRYPDIAPHLMLGWICAAMLGGALAWRPAVWPTGDRGTGKSSLLELIKLVLGPNGAITTTNTTAAGVRQALKNKSVPVLLDELETGDDGGDAVQRVIDLLRQSSSGGKGLRGGSDHVATTFQIRSAMLAASIIVPPLRSQDRSRIAVLELLPLGEDAVAPSMSQAVLQALGQRLLRRLVDCWPRLPDRLTTWRAELGAHIGLDQRGQDQYGTLLACADLALHDEDPDPDTLVEMVGRRGQKSGLCVMLGDLSADDVQDWRRCLDHLLTTPADVYRGGDRLTVGAIVARAAGRTPGADESAREEAQRALAAVGVRVAVEGGGTWLAVANQHNGLGRIYHQTIWQARSGAGGGWRQTLLRAPGAGSRPAAMRFDGPQLRVVLVPLSVALGEMALEGGV